MKSISRLFLLLALSSVASLSAFGQTAVCPTRPASGSVVTDAPELHSQNGVLTVSLTILNSAASDGTESYCYLYGDGTTEAPTLYVNPGDVLNFSLTNQLTAVAGAAGHSMSTMHGPASANPCAGGPMTVLASNVHFHGLNIPPKCHQDEVIWTNVQPGAPPFQYSIQIPANEPPGLYWYHPHPHGFTSTQVVGGAAGALIVGGMEKIRPEVAGLPERVLVIRQKALPNGSDESSVLSVNFVPFHNNLYGRILTRPLDKEFWRIVNASSVQFLQLQILGQGLPRNVEMIALDGVPLKTPFNTQTIVIPPAGRAEFVMQAPALNGVEQLVNLGFDTGPGGDSNPPALLANIVPSASASDLSIRMPAATETEVVKRFVGLSDAVPTRTRHLYFSETPDGLQFFITVDGQTPKLFDPSDPPAIVTTQGAVEDWIIENRSPEVHAFHIHQLHFVVKEINGQLTNDPALRDTVVEPYWDGVSPVYPSVKLRMDFRDPETVGTFLYHCHILDHEDGGMMAKIKVVPAK
jgi:FtsP/CotA-like multicopper oxidase with cupredoxin domain